MAMEWLCVLPVLLVMALALLSKNATASLLAGALAGCLLLTGFHPGETYRLFLDVTFSALRNEDFTWILVLMALFGALIALLRRSGGVAGFARLLGRRAGSRRGALLAAWLLGLIVFVDDYLNNLTVGAVMRGVTDRYGISRQMLTFIVTSTGATVCAVLPVSSWGAFMMGQMESAGVGGGTPVLHAFARTMPLIFYAWLAVAMIPLLIWNVVPLVGALRAAEAAAESTDAADAPEGGSALNFCLPLLVVSAATAATGDMILSVFLGLCCAAALTAAQRGASGVLETVLGGMADMFPMMLLMCASYMLSEVNARLGFTDFVIGRAVEWIAPQWFAAGAFALVALLAFGTGTFWGLAVVVFPILLPMADAVGADPYLTTGAIISGCAMGAHLCFYGDTVVLACGTTDVNTADYFRCAAPYCLLSGAASVVLYVLAGLLLRVYP